jgi:membrane protein DedA with SNARE-associated domain
MSPTRPLCAESTAISAAFDVSRGPNLYYNPESDLLKCLAEAGVIPDSAAMWAYITVLGTLLAAGLGLPIPEELPIVGAGITVGAAGPNSRIVWYIMLPVCIAGVVIGDACLYTIGRVWGQRLLHSDWVRRKVLPADRKERIERNFHRYGIWILLGARLLPGIRSPIFLMAGINRLPIAKFLIADGLYAIPGVSLLFTLAYWFGDQFMEIVNKVEQVRPLIVVCVIMAVAGILIYYFVKHPVSTGDPREVPIFGEQIASHIPKPEANGQPGESKPKEPSLDGPPKDEEAPPAVS